MGFSVSGSFAVIAVGAFIAFGMFYGAAFNAAERVTAAQQAAYEERLEQQNTDIEIVTAVYNSSTGNETLFVEINNTGATALSTSATDLLVDGVYIEHSQFTAEYVIATGGARKTATTLWQPRETYHIELDRSSADARVKVVTGPGVAAIEPVEVVS